jgi:methionyl-tRNA synthetase
MGGVVPESGPATEADLALAAVAKKATEGFDTNLSALQFRQALESLWDLVRAGNKYVDSEEPWALNKRGDTARLGAVLRIVLEVWRIVGSHLACLWPTKSGEMLAKLGLTEPDLSPTFDRLVAGTPVSAGEPLFPRLLELPPAIQAALEAARAAAPPPEPKPKKNFKADKAASPPPSPELPVSTDPAAPAAPAAPALIDYEDFAKVQLRTGVIVKADRHPKADRLLVLQVDVGEPEPRQIVAGIAATHTPESLVGQSIVVVVNLKPAKLRGEVSNGMLLAAGESAALLTAGAGVAPGTGIK